MKKNGDELSSPVEANRKLGLRTDAIHDGWSSERVPSSTATTALPRRLHGGRTPPPPLPPPFSPFNSGRTVPSKWEDAERWICSPVSGPYRNSQFLQQRNSNRPKSKSGPLGQPDGYGYGNFSPSFLLGSPFSTGVIVADEALLSCVGGANGSSASHSKSSQVVNYRNAASQGYSLSDEKHDDSGEDEEGEVSRAVSRRDMATQMSPPKSNSICSSPKERTSSSTPAKLEVRDVLIDKRSSNVISWSKRHAARIAKKGWIGVDSTNGVDQQGSCWEAAKNMSRSQREEAKIAAWENLQRAKAEAAIRKLEMKLEKKRSSSMDRIMNKLRKAELKAQTMRSSASQPRRKHFRIRLLPSCLSHNSL